MFAALIVATVVAATPAPAISPVPVTPAVVQRLDAGLRALAGTGPGQTPALSVALAENGRIVYARGFGAATPATRFRIASITKMFTAVAIMQLVEQRRIDLDAPVSTYLPAAPYAKQITVRELLQHTSGLWNYGDAAFADGSVAAKTSPAALLVLGSQHPLTGTPGAAYAYSNTGYVVLGQIVEHVTGLSLATYERQHILAVAGMHDTTFGEPPRGAPFATGYMSAAGTPAPPFDASWLYADGDIVSTAEDLVRFDDALMSGKLVKPATFALMQSASVAMDVPAARQGLGLEMAASSGLDFVGHHGGVPGFETEDEMVPANGVAFVVLSDTFDFMTPKANAVVLGAIFPQIARQSAPATVARPEDPAVTALFRTTLSNLLAGKVDRTRFADQANATLTDDILAKTAAQLAPLGTIDNVVYRGTSIAGGQTRYDYAVTFHSGATFTWAFVLDADGKISALVVTGG